MKRPSRRVAAGVALAGAALSAAALTAVAAGPADATGIPSCTGSQLVEGYRQEGGATGHGALVLEFRNRGSRTCVLHGYAGFDVRRGGKVIAHAKRTYEGFAGGSRDHTVPYVRVEPGHYASAQVEWESINGSGGCRTGTAFAFTPPGTSKTEYRSGHIPVCALQVHPTAYGRGGQHG